MKNFFLAIVIVLNLLPSVAFATGQECDPNAIDIETVLRCTTQQSGLPTFEGSRAHPDASLEGGVRNITSAILFGLDVFKLAVGSIAVLMMIVSGVKLVMVSKKIDEEVQTQKQNFQMALMGFILIIMADMFVRKMFFGEAGEAFASEADVALFAGEASQRLSVIYNIIQAVIAAIAILMIVISGIQMMTSVKEDQILNAKKHIGWAAVGLFVIAISEFFVKGILFVEQGKKIEPAGVVRIIAAMGNFLASAMGLIGVLVFAYGGFLYLTGQEDQVTKAKKVFFAGIVSFLIAAGAFAVVSSVTGIATPAFPQ